MCDIATDGHPFFCHNNPPCIRNFFSGIHHGKEKETALGLGRATSEKNKVPSRKELAFRR